MSVFYPLWTTWVGILLLARSGMVFFELHAPPAGIYNRCLQIGYPKQQDYFWFAAAIAGGFIAVAASAAVRRLLTARGWTGLNRSVPATAGTASLLGATLLAFSRFQAGSPLTLILFSAGALLPWLDGRWYERAPAWASPQHGSARGHRMLWWMLVCLVISFLWIADPCLPFTWIDGFHEGKMLLFVQHALAGETPGVHVRTDYGPLYTNSLIWWMKAFGMTVSSERFYFLAAQILGCAVHLVLVRLCCRSRLVFGFGVWLMLTLTAASGVSYGWANMLRTAFPLAAVWACWKGLQNGYRLPLAASGILLAAGTLYSQEYGIAACASCAVLFVLGARQLAVRRLAIWAIAGLLAFAFLLLLIFGRLLPGAIHAMLTPGYAFAHLRGHTVLPLPPFPYWRSLDEVTGWNRAVLDIIAIWFPGLLACASISWLAERWSRLDERRSILAAIAVFTLLAQIPVLARPMSQIAMSAPPAVLLIVLLLDMTPRTKPAFRLIAGMIMGLLAMYGAAVATPSFGTMIKRPICLAAVSYSRSQTIPRLGLVNPAPSRMAITLEALNLIRSHCPPGQRLYIAAPFYMHLAFLADRRGLSPYPSTALAATAQDRRAVLDALERQKPPVALITFAGIDIPYSWEHAEEWEYVQKHYRLKAQLDDLGVYVRR